eukprot:1996097-Rhodomonas_salina.2
MSDSDDSELTVGRPPSMLVNRWPSELVWLPRLSGWRCSTHPKSGNNGRGSGNQDRLGLRDHRSHALAGAGGCRACLGCYLNGAQSLVVSRIVSTHHCQAHHPQRPALTIRLAHWRTDTRTMGRAKATRQGDAWLAKTALTEANGPRASCAAPPAAAPSLTDVKIPPHLYMKVWNHTTPRTTGSKTQQRAEGCPVQSTRNESGPSCRSAVALQCVRSH